MIVHELLVHVHVFYQSRLTLLQAQPTSFVVTQYQYTEWSEHSCPVNYENMLVLLEDLNKVQRSSGNKPITVMCK